MENIKLLHEWEVLTDKEVQETSTEVRDGQSVTISRTVVKQTPTKMGLKQPTRRELRSAELFYGKEFNRFITMGFLPRSILINKHLNLTGGVMSEKERTRVVQLTEKHTELENDLVRALNESEEVKRKIRDELVAVRTELADINSSNESIFNQTAEKKAENQLNIWFSLFLIYISRDGKWVPYFEGETFDAKEEFMFKLEETGDKFYSLALDRISTYVYFYTMGVTTPEQFKAVDLELKKQRETKTAKIEDSPPPTT